MVVFTGLGVVFFGLVVLACLVVVFAGFIVVSDGLGVVLSGLAAGRAGFLDVLRRGALVLVAGVLVLVMSLIGFTVVTATEAGFIEVGCFGLLVVLRGGGLLRGGGEEHSPDTTLSFESTTSLAMVGCLTQTWLPPTGCQLQARHSCSAWQRLWQAAALRSAVRRQAGRTPRTPCSPI